MKSATILKQHVKPSGYVYVQLCQDGRRQQRLLHRVVLEAFVGPCPAGAESRHFPDPNKRNNRLANLLWGTHSENEQDKLAHGTRTRATAR